MNHRKTHEPIQPKNPTGTLVAEDRRKMNHRRLTTASSCTKCCTCMASGWRLSARKKEPPAAHVLVLRRGVGSGWRRKKSSDVTPMRVTNHRRLTVEWVSRI
ncbi:hypothetical protein HanRHA438_Chr09g0405181 [Helianthus annuus]|nr:hypothetical protein HanRHA438_Chr09g0405181 [Helianthus annuus]